EFKYCTNSPNHVPPTTTISIKWLPPTHLSLKLNIDGSFKGKYKKGGIGGIFRNSRGDWILGYLNSAIAYTPAYMELLALKTGLQLALDKTFVNLEIETDATYVISLLNNDTCSIYSNLVTECRSLLKKLQNSPIQHNFREGNKVAHFLATQGSKQANSTALYLMEQPPNSLLKVIHEDKIGCTKRRTISTAIVTNLVELGNPFVTCTTDVDNMVAEPMNEPNGTLYLCN
ncbi:hypothetical protein A4A49_59120, partial [Nicotiana attenuata]